jgi:hypothetical protein
MSGRLGIGPAALVLAVTAGHAFGQDTAQVAVPAMTSFEVLNVLASTVGSPNPTRVSFDNAVVPTTHAIRISVRADSDLAGRRARRFPRPTSRGRRRTSPMASA